MEQLVGRLEMGERHFNSGSYNSNEFNEFFKDFKKSFTYQLKKLKAKEISFSKGHFYITGFFKVEEQFYYFSISDVRDGVRNFYKPKMLIRTAQNPKDFTGGSNHYVKIENGMYKSIANTFRIPLPEPQKNQTKTKNDIVNNIIQKGFCDLYTGSAKKANSIAWGVDDRLKAPDEHNTSIGVAKHGRSISHCKCSTEQFNYYYDAGTKRMRIEIYNREITDEDFIKILDIPQNPQHRINPYTGQGETLEPLGVALYDFVKVNEGKSGLFDKALMMFRVRYPEQYMTLLD